MSLMSMNRALKQYGGKVIICIIAFFMLIGVVLSGFGSNIQTSTSSSGGPAQGGAEQEKAVATVGGEPVTQRQLDMVMDRMTQMQGQEIPAAFKDRYRVMLLDQFKQQRALVEAAKAEGITLSDADIAREREAAWQQQRGQVATAVGLKEDATDSQIDRALSRQGAQVSVAFLKAQGIPEDQLRGKLYADGLTAKMKQQVKVTEDTVKRTYNDIRVRHILISSGPGKLPDAQAKAKADKILAEIKADPSRFTALADQHSEDPGNTEPKTGKKNGGLYDWAPAGRYVPEFTQAALAAGVGKVYAEPVKTTYGYHIIKLEGERPGKDLPKDWDKNRAKYVDEYVTKIAQQRVNDAVQKQMPTIQVEVKDPGMKATQIETEAMGVADPKQRNAKLEQAITVLSQVTEAGDGSIAVRKAQLYQQIGKNAEAIAAYEEALKARNTVETRLALADLYLKNKEKEKALAQVTEADKLSISNPGIYDQMAALLEQAGDKAKATVARTRAAEMIKRQQAMQKLEQERMQKMQAEALKSVVTATPAPASTPAAKEPAKPTAPAATPKP